MKNSRSLIIFLAVVSVLGISLGTYTYLHRASLEIAYVYNCGVVDYKPNSLTPYCADAGAGIANIEWATWNSTGASGSADYAVNDCDPNCVSGTIEVNAVTFTLTKPVKDKGKTVFTRIDAVSSDGNNLPLMDSPKLGWDLERKPLSSVKP